MQGSILFSKSPQPERALLLLGLRGIGVILVVAGPVVAVTLVMDRPVLGALLAITTASVGLLCLCVATIAGAIFEIADKARALAGDPRFS